MKKAALSMLLLCAIATAAMADDDEAPEPGSFSSSAGFIYEFPDSSRDSDDGYGGNLSVRVPLRSRPGEGFEFDLYGLKRKADAGGHDTQIGLFASYLKAFGLYGWTGEQGVERFLPSFSPYGLVGLGAVRDDVNNDDHYAPALDTALGVAFPLNKHGLALRTEARLIGQYNKHSVPDEDVLLDWQLRIGLSAAFGAPAQAAESGVADVAPAKECGLAVVDPVTGRSDCTVDSDRDGVNDNADLCPGTVSGTPVDLNGCPALAVIDTDNDGVPDESDACANTPAGSGVDATGCVIEGQPLPLAGEPTATRKLMLSTVRFAKNSAELTPEAKSLLDQASVGLNSQTELVVEVAGHADNEGKSDYNLMLSLLRADKVRKYLVEKGVSRYRLFVEGYGETKPVAPNDTEAGRSQNRRVDLDKLDIKVTEPH